MKFSKKYSSVIIFVLISLIILTLLISYFNLDLRLQQKFYRDNSWYLANNQPWLWFYEYGPYPGIIVGILSLVFLLLSYYIKKFIPYRRYALLIVLTLIIGPGLIVNATFKDWWGRPRPRQLMQFGGELEFREVWQPGIPGKGNSFPSGHASIGFYFIVMYYIFKRRNKIISYIALGSSLIYGTLIGIARMVQGGHFASDVLWAAGFTYLTAAILYYLILKIPQFESNKKTEYKATNKAKPVLKIATYILFIALLIWIYLFSKPLYKEYEHELQQKLHFKIIDCNINNSIGDLYFTIKDFAQPLKIQTNLTGFGYPKRKVNSKYSHEIHHDTLQVNYDLVVKGLFHQIKGKTNIRLDAKYPLIISAKTEKGDIIINVERDSLTKLMSLDLSAPKGKIKKIGFYEENNNE